MKKKLIVFLLLSFQAFAADVYVRNNKKDCVGLFFNLIGTGSEYVTIKNSDAVLSKKLAEKTYVDRIADSRFTRLRRTFFKNLISKEVLDNGQEELIKRLKANELYTFVITDKEVRFASTSRSKISPKNYASKHAILANGEKPHYAGEAWMEDDVLVVNNNSGTFKPTADDLNDVAIYFQEVFGIKKVIFSSNISEPTKKSFKDYVEDFKTFLKARKTSLSQGVVNLFARDRYHKQTISIGIDGKKGDDLVFEVSDFIGSGVFGAVHKIKIKSMSEKAKKSLSHLLNKGEFREDLIVKFPHNIPLLKYLPIEDIFSQTVLRESDELKKLKNIVKEFNQEAADILLTGEAEKPFLIKKFLKAESVQDLAKIQDQLNPEQTAALERDIYKMAEKVLKDLGANLDIKAENVAWDPVNKRFVMYELSLKQGKSFFLNNGFKGYLDYFKSRMAVYVKQRKPSSEFKNLKLCEDNGMSFPLGLSSVIRSDFFDGEINLSNSEILLNAEVEFSCFKISEVHYIDNYVQMNLKVFTKESKNRFVEFGILKNLKTKNDDWIGFEIQDNGQKLGTSFLYPVLE